MDEALRELFLATHYVVCLDAVEWATIRIDQPLPASLQQRVESRTWGFITAWNPRSQSRDRVDNLAAQHALLAALHAGPEVTIYPAIGVGPTGWYEPSLFVIGLAIATLDALGNQHEQLAYVHGHASEPAQLRVLRH